ncbi:hypothetical protein [Bosea sp. BIWAKO-01]|nr:hypothetical protein [Bosea sp. BIWAKO-01]GAU85758.1 hypothetical protein BIWAKO_05706 [Bosea sp. BIWAKO-01]
MTSIRPSMDHVHALGMWLAPRYPTWIALFTLAAAFTLIAAVVV